MGSTSQTKHFRTNPVEIAIFAVVTILFGHSVYQLFNESANYKPNALTSMSSNPLSEGRNPASTNTVTTAAANSAPQAHPAEPGMGTLKKLFGGTSAPGRAEIVHSPLLSLELRCQGMTSTDTSAQKFRLTGTSCAASAVQAAKESAEESDSDSEKRSPASTVNAAAAPSAESGDALPAETRIYNQANRFAATVFQDGSTRKFTTDYIPLAVGANPIHVQFIYKGGKSFSQEFMVTRQ